MRLDGAFVWLAAIGLVGCSGTTIGISRQFDDASVPTGGAGGSASSAGGGGGGESGPGGAAGATGGATSGTDGGFCSSGSVSNVVPSRGPAPPASGGASGAGGASATTDGGRRGLPTDPCGGSAPSDCPAIARVVFSCPIVRGPDGTSRVAPGDSITVTVPVTDEGLAAYSCMGLDGPLSGGIRTFRAVSPGSVQASGQVPVSAKPGSVLHFTAVADGNPCPNDLRRLGFDVTVM